MFYTIEELVTQANQKFDGSISELMIATEIETSGRTRNEILALMSENLNVMLASINNGMTERTSRTGLTGGDALKLDSYIKNGKTLSDTTVLSAARNAMAVNESNAQMGLVCATPTAGSAGCIPAVLSTAIDKLQLTQTQQLDFLFTAGAFGLVIANNASISGAEGGCQAEVGSATAMASAALVMAAGGTPHQASRLVPLSLKIYLVSSVILSLD